MTRHQLLVAAGVGLLLAVAGMSIVTSERLIDNGTTVYLELAPVDPRALMQGDFMALDYTVAREIQDELYELDTVSDGRGRVLLRVDERGVGEYAGLMAPDGRDVPAGHLAFAYDVRGGAVQLASNAWFFEEGSADVVEPAQYGEFRVAPDGRAILVAMRDAELNTLMELLPRW